METVPEALDVLAIGAHPDDVELSCGGTIAALTAAGRRAGILDLTRGERGTRGTPEIRAREASEAARILGASVRRTLDIPDGGISTSPESIAKVVDVLRELRPRILLIPHTTDRHPDHGRAHDLCREAWFAAGLKHAAGTKGTSSLTPFRPDAMFEYMQWFEFVPSFIVDTTAVHAKKMEAVRAFRSQFHDPDSTEPSTKLSDPAFLELVEVRSRAYGEKIGTRYGEPFYARMPIGVSSPLDLITVRG